MRILVCGGAGFIGANFIQYLLATYTNINVVCIDSLSYTGNIENLENIKDYTNFNFYRGDINDYYFLESVFSKDSFNIVVNFASETSVDKSIHSPEEFLNTNILGIKNLLEMCKKYDVRKFHQTSSDCVYGGVSETDFSSKFNELSILNPTTPYAVSKSSADLLALSYFKLFNINVTISRASNVYGPYQYPEKLIPLTIRKALSNEKISIYGTGKNIRDWIYVTEYCRAIDCIINESDAGQIYNVPGNNEISNLRIVKTILDILDKSHSLIEFCKDRICHDFKYSTSGDKIFNKLGFKNNINFGQGIIKTVKWYLENQSWIEVVLKDKYIEL